MCGSHLEPPLSEPKTASQAVISDRSFAYKPPKRLNEGVQQPPYVMNPDRLQTMRLSRALYHYSRLGTVFGNSISFLHAEFPCLCPMVIRCAIKPDGALQVATDADKTIVEITVSGCNPSKCDNCKRTHRLKTAARIGAEVGFSLAMGLRVWTATATLDEQAQQELHSAMHYHLKAFRSEMQKMVDGTGKAGHDWRTFFRRHCFDIPHASAQEQIAFARDNLPDVFEQWVMDCLKRTKRFQGSCHYAAREYLRFCAGVEISDVTYEADLYEKFRYWCFHTKQPDTFCSLVEAKAELLRQQKMRNIRGAYWRSSKGNFEKVHYQFDAFFVMEAHTGKKGYGPNTGLPHWHAFVHSRVAEGKAGSVNAAFFDDVPASKTKSGRKVPAPWQTNLGNHAKKTLGENGRNPKKAIGYAIKYVGKNPHRNRGSKGYGRILDIGPDGKPRADMLAIVDKRKIAVTPELRRLLEQRKAEGSPYRRPSDLDEHGPQLFPDPFETIRERARQLFVSARINENGEYKAEGDFFETEAVIQRARQHFVDDEGDLDEISDRNDATVGTNPTTIDAGTLRAFARVRSQSGVLGLHGE